MFKTKTLRGLLAVTREGRVYGMTKKRLDRDKKWYFQGFPYYHMQVDTEGYRGYAGVIRLLAGDTFYWEREKAGKFPVCGEGMVWLQLIPEGKSRAITAMLAPEKKTIQGVTYDWSVTGWYVDVIEDWGYDEDGVAYFTDKYLDVIFTPQGDVEVDDRDELDAAYASGELSRAQYEAALAEGEAIVAELCTDIEATEVLCQKILSHVNERIAKGEDVFGKNTQVRR